MITDPNYGKYYLIGLEGTPWPIGLHGHRKVDQAWRAYHWQNEGQGAPKKQAVCTRIGRTQFENVDTGEVYETTERGIFTQAAWNEFLNSWKETE